MGDPRNFGLGPYGAGIYSRNYTDASTLVVITIGTAAAGNKVGAVKSDVVAAFMAEASANYTGSGKSDLPVVFSVVPYANSTFSADVEIPVTVDTEAYGEIVKNAVTNIEFWVEFVSGFVRVDISSAIYTDITIAPNVNIMAGAVSNTVLDIEAAPNANYMAGVNSLIELGVSVEPYATYLVGVSSELGTEFSTYASIELGDFWNEQYVASPPWVTIDPYDDIWVPVDRERPFDG